jgi:terminase large subunit-like protein
MITVVRDMAYALDPVLWVREVLGMTPTAWQEQFLRAPRGSSLLALTARQVGKTTAAAWAMAHAAIFMPGSLSIVACPAQRQSAEAVRKVRDMLLKARVKLTADNVYGLELANGSRILALPGSDDSVRGYTVDAWIVADEAARLSPELISALRPMRARRPQTRLAMLSTAWSRTDPFWSAWESGGGWIRLKATVDEDPTLFPPEFLADELTNLKEEGFKREYLGIPAGGQVSPFTWELYQGAIQPVRREVLDFPKPVLIAHDVGCSKDRSTAVVGGRCALAPEILGMREFKELPQNLYGSARANALAMVDQQYLNKTLIIADLSFDRTYAETLFERFGERVIGVQIGRYGDGLTLEQLQINNNSAIFYYKVGRTYLFDLLLRELQDDKVRLLSGEESVRAYEQLMALEVEIKQTGLRYVCPSGHHDDLAMSCALLAWASNHPHLEYWARALERRLARPKRPAPSAAGWT